MAVLAIEADPRQASAIRHIVCDLVKTKLTLVDSVADAIDALAAHTPDLILLPPIISPGDEAELQRALRSLPGASYIEMQATPMLESPGEASASARGRHPHGDSDGAGDVRAFAERVSGSLARVRQQQRAAGDRRDPAKRPGAADVPMLIALASEKAAGSAAGQPRRSARADAAGGAERRRHVRVAGPFDGFRRGVLDTPLLIQDLSESGCFVNSLHSSEYDGELTLAILLAEERWITVKAEIVRSSPGFGFGVRFVDVTDDTHAELLRVVAERGHEPQQRP